MPSHTASRLGMFVYLLSWAVCSGMPAYADVRDWLRAEVPPRLAAADIPAAVVAVVTRDGKFVEAFGTAAADSVFRVGSVSKSITASVLLALAEDGGMTLHGDLRPALEDLPIEPPLAVPLTLHHLLTHTGGFNERLFGQHAVEPGKFQSLMAYLRAHLPPRFATPGDIIAYNDHHTALAAQAAASVTGSSFATLADRYLFRPLDMHDSTFEQVDLPEHLRERLVAAVNDAGEPYPVDYIQLPAAAGLYTTAPDMARYMETMLDGTLGFADIQLTVQFAHHPELPGRGYGFAEGRHGDDPIFYKDGQASGFNARLLMHPIGGIGVFVAHNRNIFGAFGAIEPAGRFNRELGADLLQYLSPAGPAPANPRPSAAVPTTMSRDGTYRTVVAARHTWERLISLFDEVSVQSDDDRVMIGSTSYEPVGENLYADVADAARTVAFRASGARASHLFIGSGAYERVPWWTSQQALPWVVGVPLLGLVVCAALIWRSSWPFAAAGNIVLLAFFVGMGVLFWREDLQTFFRGPPPALLMLLALPLIAAIGIAGQLLIWKRNPAVHTVSVLCGAVLLAWLNYWNLLGYRLG